MWKVDIYLETDSTFQGKRERKCGYVLSTMVENEEKTKENFGISKGTYHQSVLMTLIENAAEWEQVYRLIHAFPDPHKMTARSEKYSYSTWMQEEMKKNECGRIMGQGLESETGPESNDNGIPGNDNPPGS